MKFATVPVQVAGSSYQSRSRPLSSQKTVNWWPNIVEQGKDQFVLFPFHGLLPIGNADGADRGFHRMGEVLYQVKGESLYKINGAGGHLLLGSIPGTKRCIMADDGFNMFICNGDGDVFQYSSDTGIVTSVTDTNIVGALSIDFINNQFLYTKTNFTTVSDVGNGASASGLNIIGEETLPDALIRDFVYDEVIYRCGTRSIVSWYNSGVGNPPIEKIQGRIFQVGLAARHSISRNDDVFYWLGDDYCVYRSAAGSKERVSTDAMSDIIKSFGSASDATGACFTLSGLNFYVIHFPTGKRTFALNERLGVNGWFELSSGTSDEDYQVSSIIDCYGKLYAADSRNGNIYLLDENVYTNNGGPIKRVRVTGSVNGELIGAKGSLIQMSRVRFLMETGTGLINGQGDNPRIMVEHSDDGGRTWTHGGWPRVGRLGEFTLQVDYYNLDTFYDRIFRISTTDPVGYTIYSATIDLRAAGR